MFVETREWYNEQPDGGIVYFVSADLFEDDGTKLGTHTRQWHLDVRAPTTGEVAATRDTAKQWALDHAQEMRQRHENRQKREQEREQRRQRAQQALSNLSS